MGHRLITMSLVMSAGLLPFSASAADYEPSAIPGWEQIVFSGHTQYRQTKKCIEAVSQGAASGLIQRVDISLSSKPMLTWGWQSSAPLTVGVAAPEKTKPGDDFVARVYVIREGFFPWQTKAINYVWSREHPVGSYWPNPFTSNAMMVVLQTGEEGLGQWQHFERNIRADFKTYFDLDVENVSAVAVMTDTDNTGGEATACYELPVFK
tara:strand:- start:2853 stop:3476 length:624 start_codon:yes stop_codon:yes gene_type:complete